MIIHPELRALRRDDTPQRKAQEALYEAIGAWRSSEGVVDVILDVEALDKGGCIEGCAALDALFDEGNETAFRFVDGFVQAATTCLAGSTLGHVLLRHFTDGTSSTLLLARSGNVTLSLVAVDGDGFAERPEPVTADFPDNEVWERVMSGEAYVELVDRLLLENGATLLDSTGIELEPGRVLYRKGRRQALLLREVSGCLVMLRLQRRRTDAGPNFEYDLSDGRLVHRAAGSPKDSRLELMMALAGRMNRIDAVPHMSAIALGEGDRAVRWQAVRECLALDTLTGFETLNTLARSEADELSGIANALRSSLVEAHPQLAEMTACPA